MTKETKFNTSKNKTLRTHDDIVFDSAVEMKFYRDVVIPALESGELLECELQKKYILQPGFIHHDKKILPIEYKADFYLKYSNGLEKVIDIKGFADAQAKIKRKMFWYAYPEIDYEWISYSRIDGGWVAYDEVQKARTLRRKAKKEI